MLGVATNSVTLLQGKKNTLSMSDVDKSVSMKKKKEPKESWRVIRKYNKRFSSKEAIEKIIKAHMEE